MLSGEPANSLLMNDTVLPKIEFFLSIAWARFLLLLIVEYSRLAPEASLLLKRFVLELTKRLLLPPEDMVDFRIVSVRSLTD